ncbi:HAD family phosphatase [bacterium]|nr:HAD family phosphatase [bacterium]
MVSNVKAILFDMDGVLLDSERVWRKYEKETFSAVGIEELPENLKKKIYGISMKDEFALLKGTIKLNVTYEEYVSNYDKFSRRVYSESALAANLENVLQTLKNKGLKLAIVSASLQPWIELALKRLQKSDYFDLAISLADTPGLRQKPEPDGYLRAMEILCATPKETLVIEDSNRGLKSGRASGAVTIATSEFIDSAVYKQEGYDEKIEKLEDLLEYLPD